MFFGSFCLFPKHRLLLKDGKAVPIGGRALDILIALLERPGEVVRKGELIARVWPDSTVEETNLKVHIATLRRMLGDGQLTERYISTVVGRGYCFVASVSHGNAPLQNDTFEDRMEPPSRTDLFDSIVSQLTSQRFIVVVGAGEMVESLFLAAALRSEYEHGVFVVDLARIDDPISLPAAVSIAIGAWNESNDPASSLMAFLDSRHLLLVLDNCRDFVAATAAFANKVVSQTRRTHILAISR
jgi:DNA-binding winged helix-turn-helix (wHTH) protein